jgi:hypothetical protein
MQCKNRETNALVSMGKCTPWQLDVMLYTQKRETFEVHRSGYFINLRDDNTTGERPHNMPGFDWRVKLAHASEWESGLA